MQGCSQSWHGCCNCCCCCVHLPLVMEVWVCGLRMPAMVRVTACAEPSLSASCASTSTALMAWPSCTVKRALHLVVWHIGASAHWPHSLPAPRCCLLTEFSTIASCPWLERRDCALLTASSTCARCRTGGHAVHSFSCMRAGKGGGDA